MKVREFFESLPNKPEVLEKIRKFKEQKRKEEFLTRFEACNICLQPIKFGGPEFFMQNLMDDADFSCCAACGQKLDADRYISN